MPSNIKLCPSTPTLRFDVIYKTFFMALVTPFKDMKTKTSLVACKNTTKTKIEKNSNIANNFELILCIYGGRREHAHWLWRIPNACYAKKKHYILNYN